MTFGIVIVAGSRKYAVACLNWMSLHEISEAVKEVDIPDMQNMMNVLVVPYPESAGGIGFYLLF